MVATAFHESTTIETVNAPQTKAASDYGKHELVRSSAPRPEVLKAMGALREMPPLAQEREIDFGRYSNFSPQERQLLRSLEKQPTND